MRGRGVFLSTKSLPSQRRGLESYRFGTPFVSYSLRFVRYTQGLQVLSVRLRRTPRTQKPAKPVLFVRGRGVFLLTGAVQLSRFLVRKPLGNMGEAFQVLSARQAAALLRAHKNRQSRFCLCLYCTKLAPISKTK